MSGEPRVSDEAVAEARAELGAVVTARDWVTLWLVRHGVDVHQTARTAAATTRSATSTVDTATCRIGGRMAGQFPMFPRQGGASR